MYRYLFFDADGTLFDFNEAESRALYQTAQTVGFSLTEEQLHQYKASNAACWKAFERFEITQATLKVKRFEDFFKEANLPFDPTHTSQVFQGYLSHQGVLFQESLPLLQTLTERGYTLYLATNGIAEVQRGRIAQSKIGHYFQEIFISEEIGAQKPDTRFFTHMLEHTRLEARKRECLMIGDSLVSDIEGGVLAGLDTVWVNLDGQYHNTTSIQPTYVIERISDMANLLVTIPLQP